ncbi:hypothetical protein [Streptomonospora salina]|uniref:Uncharacterized protein n=1 Tax=Streptomonospora salina TaxID=104205 RepID=A0A841EBR6_9ACTN|nr:hypothetical protein [Streptomonospora salina]MBB5999864.1 hypothetical protein [Streptomonospora salina]
MGNRRALVVVLVLLVGAVAVGLASVGADRVPFTAREAGTQDHTVPTLLYFALITLVDTFLGWCAVPVLLAYRAARSAGRAAAIGGVFALAALAVYTAGAYLAQVSDARRREAWESLGHPPPPAVPEPDALESALGMALSPMLPMAVVGAVLGALAGYHARRRPLLLLVLAAAAAVDLWRRADTPWVSVANGLPNVLLVAAAVAVAAWAVAATLRRRGAAGATSGAPV